MLGVHQLKRGRVSPQSDRINWSCCVQVLELRQGMQFQVNTKSRGDTFGEVSLMYNVPRSATVAAKSASVVWVLERDTFRYEQRVFRVSGSYRCILGP